MNLANALNGGKVTLWADTVGDGTYALIGGQTAHSKSMTFEPIDISSKALPEERCYLEGEGKQMIDVTAEVLWSSEAAYQFVRGKADAKEFFSLKIRYDDYIDNNLYFDVLATTVGDNADQNTAASSSITLSSTGATGKKEYSLELYFANDSYYIDTGDGGVFVGFSDIITFSRSTTGTYINQSGVLTTAAINEPRLSYDPATGESLGLLIEGASTNLLTYSEQIDNAAWSVVGSSVVASATIAPDGSSSADKLVEDSSNGVHYAIQTPVVSLGGNTYSVFVKVQERLLLTVFLGSNFGGQNNSVRFDVLSGSYTVTEGAVDGASITQYGGGWYRLSVSAEATTAGAVQAGVFLSDQSGSSSYQGDGTSGIYIWGAQLEQKPYATSYIKTEASQVTRAADLASVDDLSGWYNQSEGSVFVDSSTGISPIQKYDVSFGGGVGGLGLFTDGSLSYAASIAINAFSLSKADKKMVSYSGTNFTLSIGGNYRGDGVDLSGGVPSVLFVGRNNAQNFLDGHIKRLAYYSAAKTEGELKAPTS